MHPQSRTLPVPQSEEDVTLLGEVAAQGWQLVVREGLSQQISYAYTVGLYRNFDHPEVIVSGQSVEKLKEMLQRICQRVEAGDLLVELAEVGGIFEKYYDVVFRTVLKKNYPRCFDRAIWFYQGTQFPAMQCVWPNYQHLYPFDAHYDNRGVKGQLKLYASGDPNRPYVKVRLVRTLRTLLGSLPLGAILKESEELSTVLNCLDWLIPDWVGWGSECLDGIVPSLVRKTAEGAIEIFGYCWVLSTQEQVPLHLHLEISAVDDTDDRIHWLECHLCERRRKKFPHSFAEQTEPCLAPYYYGESESCELDWGYAVIKELL